MYLARVEVAGYRASAHGTIECDLPGRFAVLLGANSGGKSTIADAIVLAHPAVFPRQLRPPAEALSETVIPRRIKVEYAWEADESRPVWQLRQASGTGKAPIWSRTLRPQLGQTRIEGSSEDGLPIVVLHLSPTRDPGRELAGRDARLLVELLRAESRRRGGKGLAGLRMHLGNLLKYAVRNPLVTHTEGRVGATLTELTSGVSARTPFLATTDIDDALLARIFDFYLSATIDRADARHLELDGLGYQHLLYLAVILAAIPDLSHVAPPEGEDIDPRDEVDPYSDPNAPRLPDQTTVVPGGSDEAVRAGLREATRNAERLSDTFFPPDFHAVIVLEEPEAHLHPQLAHGLVRYLRRIVRDRPEIQIVITTHSTEVVAGCDPNELVVLRRDDKPVPQARTVKNLELPSKHIKSIRRQLDVTRSATLFADRLVLVEGPTDALLLRTFGYIWAAGDAHKRRFLDALTITVAASRVGEWLPALLVTPDYEIAQRVAALMDSDHKPLPPAWAARSRWNGNFRVFRSKPTLEPSLLAGNEKLVTRVLRHYPKSRPWDNDPAHADADKLEAWIGGKGRERKAGFADYLCDEIQRAPQDAKVPTHLQSLLNYLYDSVPPRPAGAPPLPPPPDDDDLDLDETDLGDEEVDPDETDRDEDA